MRLRRGSQDCLGWEQHGARTVQGVKLGSEGLPGRSTPGKGPEPRHRPSPDSSEKNENALLALHLPSSGWVFRRNAGKRALRRFPKPFMWSST